MLRKRVRSPTTTTASRLRTTDRRHAHVHADLIVFIAIGTTDLLFALDSIPAIFGITQSPFIVFTANVFALMGLRQLYFLLGGLLERLEYLKYGIAFILAFIGVKLVFHALHVNELPFLNGGEPIEWAPEISTWVSLGVIVAAMAVATIASLVKANTNRSVAARSSWTRCRTSPPTATAPRSPTAPSGRRSTAVHEPAQELLACMGDAGGVARAVDDRRRPSTPTEETRAR